MQHPLTCLLVDNGEEDQEIFHMALQEAAPHIQCAFVNNGPDTLQKPNTDISFLPSLIFIDMNMPLMNGMRCPEEIKKTASSETGAGLYVRHRFRPLGCGAGKKAGAG